MANPNPSNPIKPGETRNPNGRPKKKESLTYLVKRYLNKVEPKSKKLYKELFVKRVVHKAIADGDFPMIKLLWNYMEGMPQQNMEMTVNPKEEINKIMEAIDGQVDDAIKEAKGEGDS